MKDNNCSNRQVVFIAYTAYQLFNAIYYSTVIDWKGRKRVLVWQQFLSHDLERESVTRFFDQIVVLERLDYYPNEIRRFKKCIQMGFLFPFSKLSRMLKQTHTDFVFAFSDQDALTIRIIDSIKKLYCGKVILIEEGMNTYAIKFQKKEKLATRMLGIKSNPFIAASNNVDILIVKRPEDLKPEKTKDKVIIKQNNVFLDKDWLRQFYAIDLSIKALNGFSSTKGEVILWLSGPLVEKGISESEELSLLRTIASHFRDKKILIKKHPRENPDKYTAIVSENNIETIELGDYFWIPVELIALYISPYAVITIMSTAAANLCDIGLDSKFIYCFNLFQHLHFDCSVFDKYTQKNNNYAPQTTEELFKLLGNESEKTDRICLPQNTDEDLKYINSMLVNK